MSRNQSYLFDNKDRFSFLSDVPDHELSAYYGYYMRLARASWLKAKFGDLDIPSDLFRVVVDADVVPEVFDMWYALGGIHIVYYYCKIIFGEGDVDCDQIRVVQDEIDRNRNRIKK